MIAVTRLSEDRFLITMLIQILALLPFVALAVFIGLAFRKRYNISTSVSGMLDAFMSDRQRSAHVEIVERRAAKRYEDEDSGKDGIPHSLYEKS